MERIHHLSRCPTTRRHLCHLEHLLPGDAPIVVASDYVRANVMPLAGYLDGRFVALGTDGFGRSDTRTVLRRFFEVDRRNIAVAALDALAHDGTIDSARVAEAIARYGIDATAIPSWNC